MLPSGPNMGFVGFSVGADQERIDKHREIDVPTQIHMGCERIAAHTVGNRQRVPRRIHRRSRRDQKQSFAFHHDFGAPWDR